MDKRFSIDRVEGGLRRQGPASGIDREVVHRIRVQGRRERAKIVHQGILWLKRAVGRLICFPLAQIRFAHRSAGAP